MPAIVDELPPIRALSAKLELGFAQAAGFFGRVDDSILDDAESLASITDVLSDLNDVLERLEARVSENRGL